METLKDTYQEAIELLYLCQATIAANQDLRKKEVGDRVVVWDGSGNVDKHTGKHRFGIDPLFKEVAIVIEIGCNPIGRDEFLNKITGRNCDAVCDLLLKFPSGEEVYCSSKFVRIV